ncbi:hypothetical protein CD29_15175 [Ureibacillus manganicus DSM 26584]|uniref:Uncharacterized protein n=2 Tax=Ureibacillus TaxID=160795 RepID=A0A0A3IRF0_9BACL|nr:hypothetical protein CD29_15175 [Ureibacillus manganicus DSM 26584]
MLMFAEILLYISTGILIISSGLFLRYLLKTKKQRKLTKFEFTMYIVLQTAFILFGISFIITRFII